MNKQELIKKYEGAFEKLYAFPVVTINEVLEDLRQLDEPQKVTIPQFVAGWMNYCKLTGVDLYHAFEMGDLYLGNYAYQKDYPKLKGYFESENNQETFARAWLDGYTVEEKRYLVSLRNGQPLVKTPLGKDFYFNQNILAEKYKATRKELEQAGFGWVFDCPGVEIEEVER